MLAGVWRKNIPGRGDKGRTEARVLGLSRNSKGARVCLRGSEKGRGQVQGLGGS